MRIPKGIQAIEEDSKTVREESVQGGAEKVIGNRGVRPTRDVASRELRRENRMCAGVGSSKRQERARRHCIKNPTVLQGHECGQGHQQKKLGRGPPKKDVRRRWAELKGKSSCGE